jgi:hypothetical protein
MMKAAMIVEKTSSDEDHADEEDKEAALARMLKSDPTMSVTATEELRSPPFASWD